MNICLLTSSYPPQSTEGIPRQRQALAHELRHQGHAVVVVSCDGPAGWRDDGGVPIYTAALPASRRYCGSCRELDAPLAASQALHDGLLEVRRRHRIDVVDTPIWCAPGFVTLERADLPVVLWLQTTSAQQLAGMASPPENYARGITGLERRCVERADGILADSVAALDAVVRDYGYTRDTPHTVVHLGLPPGPALADDAVSPAGGPVEALVVGRLEERKGTPVLFELLPDLLRTHPELRVRFVGRDNSGADGWQARHGMDYPAYFRARHPHLSSRVCFEGYVAEEDLPARYREAAFVVAPSRYESFGLVYLEAMRAARPVLTFAAGGAAEVFAEGASHGALLVPPGDGEAFARSLGRLAGDAALRQELGRRAAQRFQEAFTSGRMAEKTAAFYEEVVRRQTIRASPRGARCHQVYQVMHAVDAGDAVSHITVRNAEILAELGQPAEVLADHVHPRVRVESSPLHRVLSQPGCALLFHYWNYSPSAWALAACRGRRAVYYHNIPPPHWFPPGSELYRSTARGYAQLWHVAAQCELVVGDSLFNIREFARFLPGPRPGLVIPPPVGDLLPAPGRDRREQRGDATVKFLFVGRIARNKRQDLLMRMFDYYCAEINPDARLWLVGGYAPDPGYRAELDALRRSLRSSDRIVFTGKVSDEALAGLYRRADLFVCASEHEGFCMPVVEAMKAGLPVVAQACAAVPETVGEGGLLLGRWDAPRAAELAHEVLTNGPLRQRVIAAQRRNLQRFTRERVKERLAAAMSFLVDGVESPLFERLEPGAPHPVGTGDA